jgi:hypothetical protein
LVAALWLPLLAALVWGKCAIPGADVRRLLARSAKLSVGVGAPMMFGAVIWFARMNPHRLALSKLCGAATLLAGALLPFCGVFVTTSVFQERHRAARARGEARPFAVRLLSGVVILVANAIAWGVILFPLFVSTGVYDSWD